ncbi:MAG: hypothetical protein LC647_03225, partial [Beggiatoa sp.]|nr:hypothetical protein [Beggiatoa sp.]
MSTPQSAAFRAHITGLILLVSGLSGCQGLRPVEVDEWLRGERVAPFPPSLEREDEPVVLADPAPRTDTFALSEDTSMVGALY